MGGTIAAIWSSIWNGLAATVAGIWGGIISTVRRSVDTIVDIIGGISDAVNGALGFISDLTGGLVNLKIPKLPGMASGGLVNGPQRRLIGEAGPEAVVPLDRPLSRVDPSVRGLSAIAQGLAGPMASGGVSGGKTVVVEAGAITVVTAATNGTNIANALLDRIIVNLPS